MSADNCTIAAHVTDAPDPARPYVALVVSDSMIGDLGPAGTIAVELERDITRVWYATREQAVRAARQQAPHTEYGFDGFHVVTGAQRARALAVRAARMHHVGTPNPAAKLPPLLRSRT